MKHEKAARPPQSEVDHVLNLLSTGGWHDAIQLLGSMTARFPDYAFGWKLAGVVYRRIGRSQDALAHTQTALSLHPQDPELHSNLGNVWKDLGVLDKAQACYRQALALHPDYADAHSGLANTLRDLGLLDEAAQHAQRAVTLKPANPAFLNNFAQICHRQGLAQEAENYFRRALALNPSYAEGLVNLGNLLAQDGRSDEAEAYYRSAIQAQPRCLEAFLNLGRLLSDTGRQEQALNYFRYVLRLKPNYYEVLVNLGNTLKLTGRLDEAEVCYRQAIQIQPGLSVAHYNLANTLKYRGRVTQAVQFYEQAIALAPEFVDAHTNLLFSLNFLQHPGEVYLVTARRFAAMLARKVGRPFRFWPHIPSDGRIRVGIVSGDLCRHPVSYFLLPLVNNLDASRFALFIYATNDKTDHVTDALRQKVFCWRSIRGVSDDGAADLIHADGLHILIDLAGHTEDNRLAIFCRRPAPVQVAWLGYFASTGIAEIDYILVDPWTVLNEEERHFSEKFWFLPETRLCFSIPEQAPEVSALPALSRQYLTFGCFNKVPKISPETITTWSRILLALPDSRLFLKAEQLKDAPVREQLAAQFSALGVHPGRLRMEGYTPRASYLEAYCQVDIALDPFPFSGGTTSIEAMWMGVPVLTLAGAKLVARQGVGIMMNAGLPEWVALDQIDYVQRAIAYAQDWQALALLRAGLRDRIRRSPMFDGPRFARKFESALVAMSEQRALNLTGPGPAQGAT